MLFRSEPSWWIVLLLGKTLSKKYVHKKKIKIKISIRFRSRARRKENDMNSSLSFGKAATQLLHFASPCPLILLFVTCPARNSSCPTLYLFFVALIETKTTCSYSQTMVGQGLCCVSLATQLLTRTVFFTLFARLRSPCKLSLPSHTLTTVSLKRRRCISLTNYSHGKGLKPPISSDSFCSEVAEAVLISVLDAKKTTDCGP